MSVESLIFDMNLKIMQHNIESLKDITTHIYWVSISNLVGNQIKVNAIIMVSISQVVIKTYYLLENEM